MPLPRPFVASLLAASLLLNGCGGTSEPSLDTPKPGGGALEPAGAKVADLDLESAANRIARLVPANTAMYVQIESFAKFDALLDRLGRSSDEYGRQIDEAARAVHRMIPGDERQVLRDQPIGIAVTLPADRPPELTFVLPVKDVIAYKRSLQIAPHLPQPIYDGVYLSVTQAALFERAREPVAIALGLPADTLAARIDVARLDRRFGSQIRLALAAFDPEDPAWRMAGWNASPRALSALDSSIYPMLYALSVGQQFDLSFDVRGDRLQVRCAVETREAGALAAWTASEPVDLMPFARQLVASDTFAFVGGCERKALVERLAALLTSDELERERVGNLLASFADRFGSIGALSGSLGDGDSHFALHVRANNDPAFPHQLASTFELFSRSGLGVEVVSKRRADFEGVTVEDLTVHFDAASMCALTGERTDDIAAVQTRLDGLCFSLFGAESVRVRIAAFGERALIAVGNDEVWFRRTLLWAKEDKDMTPPDVRAAIEHLGETRAGAIVRVELARWLEELDEWRLRLSALTNPSQRVRRSSESRVHALDPRPLTLHVGAEGRRLSIGLSVGLASAPAPETVRR